METVLTPTTVRQVVDLLLQLIMLVGVPLLGLVARRALALMQESCRDQQVRSTAYVAVRAAEQLLPDNHAKYVYAAGRITAQFPALAGHETEIQALIEAAVHELKRDLAPPVPPAPAIG